MTEPLLHALTLIGAFWTAALCFAIKGGDQRDAARFVAGLALGAAASHLGWALLHPRTVLLQPLLLLDPAAGYTVLTLPLGLIASVPWRARARRRSHYLATALGTLPLAIAVARIGCWISGCCYGIATQLPWGVVVAGEPTPVHPVPVYEALGWVGVFALLQRVDRAWVAAAVLIAFGALRLMLEPLRAAPPLGPPAIAPAWIALAWLALGILLTPAAQHLLGSLLPSRGSPGSRHEAGRTTTSACRTPPPVPPRARLPSSRRAGRTRSGS